MLNFKLYPFMDADGVGNGVATGQEGGIETVAAQAESGQKRADEPKTGTDVQTEAVRAVQDGIRRRRAENLLRVPQNENGER